MDRSSSSCTTPPPSPLLREWSRNNNNDNNDNNDAPSPLVLAPAVVVPQQHSQQQSQQQQSQQQQDDNNHNHNHSIPASSSFGYPVATFVRDMVRSSLEQMHIYAPASVADALVEEDRMDPNHHHHHHDHDDDDDANHRRSSTSTRTTSLHTTTSARSAPLLGRSNHYQNNDENPNDTQIPIFQGQPATQDTIRSLDAAVDNHHHHHDDDCDFLEDQEFVLIDGDLVALPPPPPNAREQDEIDHPTTTTSHHHHHHHHTTSSRRKGRGIRKLLFRKKKQPPDERKKRTKRRSWKRPAGPAAPPELPPPPSSLSPRLQAPRPRLEQHHVTAVSNDNNNNINSSSSSTPPLFAPMVRISEAISSAVSADFIGNADQLNVTDTGVTTSAPANHNSTTITTTNNNHNHHNTAPTTFHNINTTPVLTADAYYIDEDADPKVDTLLTQATRETQLERDQAESTTSSLFLFNSTNANSIMDDDTTGSLHPTHHSTPPPKRTAVQLQDNHCPLSLAASPDATPSTVRQDDVVVNDTLKVVMLGSAHEKSALARAWKKGQSYTSPLRNNNNNNNNKPSRRSRTTLGVDVYPWHTTNLNVVIWDVQGATTLDATLANAGRHSSTQSLFYSSSCLYILCWDLAATRVIPIRQRNRLVTSESMDYEEDEEEEEDEFWMEQANRQTDRCLEADIDENVLSWMDTIPVSSAVLPVVMLPQQQEESASLLGDFEVERRCDIMQMLLINNFAIRSRKGPCAKLVFGTKDEKILCVDIGKGVRQLQKTVVSIATGGNGKDHIFPHVGTPVPSKTVDILRTIQRLRKDHKVILIDHLLAEMTTKCGVAEATEALHFLSNIGELLYFGVTGDEVLSRYIILSRRWLVSALSCILRNDLKRELTETRRFMNLQCAYSGQAFSENDVAQTLLSDHSSTCPLLSSADSNMLWQSMSFMREAADRTAQLSEASSTMFDFLERLLVHKGVFLPLKVSQPLEEDEPIIAYFVPSLLAPSEPADVWTFKSSDSWMTTLCHSWVLGDGTTLDLMEHVTVALLHDLYEFAQNFQGGTHHLAHSVSYPMGFSSITEFMETHDEEVIGRVSIHQVMTWKSSVLIKIGCVFCQADSREMRESMTEVFISLVDAQSPLCVSSDFMGTGMKQLVVSSKGQVGNHGQKMWNGGLRLILDSIKASIGDVSNVERQVVCPECLAHSHPNVACTWGWEDVCNMTDETGSGLRCMRGHVVDLNLLRGTIGPKGAQGHHPSVHGLPGVRVTKPVSSLLQSTVLVGLWDSASNSIRNVGSGFIADRKLGLVVTAGHILFDMTEGPSFGTPYFGLKDAKVVIGVIPDESHTAVFRYFAQVAAHDITNVDACVIRITTRMENDVEGEGEDCGKQSEIPLMNDPEAMKNEKLQHLKMTRRFELEEACRLLGYNQGGEGLLEEGKHVNRCADFAKGYVCKKFRAHGHSMDDSASESSSSTCFNPREEIVVMCPTISGHSGGPCVNDEGRVLGILSRADPVDRQRCYLVPSNEIKDLISLAKDRQHPSSMGSLPL